MDPAPRSSRIRRIGSLLPPAFACLLALLSLSQCKYGPDKVTGLDRHKHSPASACIHQCAEQYEDSLEAEHKLHKKNLELCGDGDDGDGDDDGAVLANPAGDGDDGGGDDDGGDSACIAQEQARHRAAIERIKAGQQQCIEGCHHQGGGTGR